MRARRGRRSIVSNHGGRQLDGAPATIDALPEVVEAIDGRIEVLVDGGVRRGTDVVKALGLGARAVLVGRPPLWGLAVDGEAGARRVLELLQAEIQLALQLVGCRTPADVTRAHVSPAPLPYVPWIQGHAVPLCAAHPRPRRRRGPGAGRGRRHLRRPVPDAGLGRLRRPRRADPGEAGDHDRRRLRHRRPAQFRDAGAATVLFDLNFNKRVGTTSNPADPSVIDARAKSLFDYAVPVTGCQTPTIAENELAGAQTPTPWTPNNAQYRANVLQFLTDLTNLGATPLLSIANPPYTGSGDAAYWWQQVSKVAILLRQVYFTSPNAAGLYKLGPAAASLSMRQSLRGLVNHLTQIGIPSGRIALEMQLTTSPGLGQRAGLQPQPWFEIVKLEALAAKFVATQFKLQGVWSWGWATFNAERDARPGQAVRRLRLALGAATRACATAPPPPAPGSTTSLTEGQLDVPAGARCLHERRLDLPQRGRAASPR